MVLAIPWKYVNSLAKNEVTAHVSVEIQNLPKRIFWLVTIGYRANLLRYLPGFEWCLENKP